MIPESTVEQREALLRDFVFLSSIGATAGGGVDREAATVADGQARTWFAGHLHAAGFEVTVDPIGNVFGVLELVPGAPTVLAGSHLDSQPTAGRFDGAYGVLAALHAARRVHEQVASGAVAPTCNLAVVDWCNEEGSRFSPSMMGSGVFTGVQDLDAALATTDPGGVTMRDALDAIGQRGAALDADIAAYAEIHVEQGREMAERGIAIGLVERTWAARKLAVTVHGEQAHTGATVMRDRRDALYGAAALVVALRELADEFDDGVLHTSVGRLDVAPNSPVVVASEVRLLADLRAADAAVLAEASARLPEIVADVERRARVRVDLHQTHAWDAQHYQAAGVDLVERLLGGSTTTRARTVTIAGHDSTNMKDVVPAIMLFVPSEGGIAHNEGELTLDDDLVTGADVLTGVLAALVAGEPGVTDVTTFRSAC